MNIVRLELQRLPEDPETHKVVWSTLHHEGSLILPEGTDEFMGLPERVVVTIYPGSLLDLSMRQNREGGGYNSE